MASQTVVRICGESGRWCWERTSSVRPCLATSKHETERQQKHNRLVCMTQAAILAVSWSPNSTCSKDQGHLEFPGITEFSARISGNFENFCSEYYCDSLLLRKLSFPLSSNLNHQLGLYLFLHSSNWSFWPFWCCLLFQWYNAAIGTWLLIWLSIDFENWSIGFDRNQIKSFDDGLIYLISNW